MKTDENQHGKSTSNFTSNYDKAVHCTPDDRTQQARSDLSMADLAALGRGYSYRKDS